MDTCTQFDLFLMTCLQFSEPRDCSLFSRCTSFNMLRSFSFELLMLGMYLAQFVNTNYHKLLLSCQVGRLWQTSIRNLPRHCFCMLRMQQLRQSWDANLCPAVVLWLKAPHEACYQVKSCGCGARARFLKSMVHLAFVGFLLEQTF